MTDTDNKTGDITVPSNLFDIYEPVYLKDICEARGGINQIFLYYSLLAGLKPALDEWIQTDQLDHFRDVCSKYSLVTEVESIFFDENSEHVRDSVGSSFLTTTISCGAPADTDYQGRAHIFISKSQETLDSIKQSGWYPLSVNSRIVTKPHIDYLWFGEDLGYPKCCIEYFARFNDHSKYANTLMLPFTNTKSKPNFLCNSLVKDSYSYLYHIPCSFDCCSTADLSYELRRYILEYDPGYVEYIDRHMKLNFIVFAERNIYAFDGRMDDNVLIYDNAYFVDSYLYQGEFLGFFLEGNKIVFYDDKFTIYNNDRLIHTIYRSNRQEWFFISFSDD